MKPSLIPLVIAVFALAAVSANAQTSPLLPGDVVVSIYGNVDTPTANNSYADGQATPISLEQFSPVISAGADSGTPLLTETLPNTGTGANVGIIGEYGSSSEGTILVSGDGSSLTIGGYDGNEDENGAPSGGYSVGDGTAEAQSTCLAVPRVFAVVNIGTGAVDTSTVLNDVYNTNNPRGCYSPDGSTLYISGQGAGKSDEGGLYQTARGTVTQTGGTAPTPLFNVVSTRTVTQLDIDAANGVSSTTPNLYYSADQNSSSKGTLTGIFEYSPTPTSSEGSNTGTRLTPASALVGGQTANLSPEGYFFANATTLYVADTGSPKAGSPADGGIQKWSYSSAGNVWTLDYTLTYNFPTTPAPTPSNPNPQTLSETGFAGLAGKVVNGVVYLYATSYTANDDDPDGLYGVTDTLSNTSSTPTAGEAIVELAASSPDMDFKGVAITPGTFSPNPPLPTDSPTMPRWGLGLLAVLMLVAGARFLPRNGTDPSTSSG